MAEFSVSRLFYSKLEVIQWRISMLTLLYMKGIL